MKAFYLVSGLCAAALLGACTVYEPATYAYNPPARVAYVAPTTTYVAPGYVVLP
jgi:hypothetical protein